MKSMTCTPVIPFRECRAVPLLTVGALSVSVFSTGYLPEALVPRGKFTRYVPATLTLAGWLNIIVFGPFSKIRRAC